VSLDGGAPGAMDDFFVCFHPVSSEAFAHHALDVAGFFDVCLEHCFKLKIYFNCKEDGANIIPSQGVASKKIKITKTIEVKAEVAQAVKVEAEVAQAV
jgi:hypothetical protein